MCPCNFSKEFLRNAPIDHNLYDKDNVNKGIAN